MDFTGLLKEIESHDSICIFRHEHPDCDAVGSQFGLKQWLQDNYPEKKIYALGFESCSQGSWPESDQANESVIQNSLAIVLDTSNLTRVDDMRCSEAFRIIKIDHHPNREPFGTLNFVHEEAAATCEILSAFFQNSSKTVSLETANRLYCGLLTDTLCFRTSNTTAHTLAMASYIAGFGVDIPQINRMLFDQSLSDYKFAGYMRSHYQMMGSYMVYAIVPLTVQNQFHMTGSEVRNFIDEFGHVREFRVWAVFTEKIQDGRRLYDGSLRSKTITVNDIAEQFNGGGHRNAAGVKNLDEESLNKLLQSLFSRVSKK